MTRPQYPQAAVDKSWTRLRTSCGPTVDADTPAVDSLGTHHGHGQWTNGGVLVDNVPGSWKHVDVISRPGDDTDVPPHADHNLQTGADQRRHPCVHTIHTPYY